MTTKTFAELLAEKKAALATSATAPSPTITPTPTITEHTTDPIAEDKPLSFAERMKLAAASPSTVERPTIGDPPPSPTPPAPITTPVEEPKLEIAPKVVISADIIAKSNAVIAAGSAIEADSEAESLSLIKERIARLATIEGLDLKSAMDGLKALILANPSACAQLLPEDVGEMVTALRAMTNNTVAAALAGPTRSRAKTKQPTLDADELSALIEDLL